MRDTDEPQDGPDLGGYTSPSRKKIDPITGLPIDDLSPDTPPPNDPTDPNRGTNPPPNGRETTTTTTTPEKPTYPGAPADGNWEGWFNTLFPGADLSPAQLIAQEAAINAAGAKVLRNAKGVAGKIQLPDGRIVDVIQGADSGFNKRQWLIGGTDTPAAAPAGTPAAASTGSTGDSALSAFLMNWLTGQSTANSANRNALFQRLMGLADEYGKPVTADDPNIKAASDAYHGISERSLQTFRTRAAERAHAEGVGTGSFDAAIGNATMGAGQNEAGYTTQLMNTELQNRRTALLQTLQQAGSQLSAADQAEIQAKIAAIDGLLKGKGLDLQDKGLNIQDALGWGSLDLQKLLGLGSLGNQGTSIANQNRQFYDNLTLSNAFNEKQLDFLYRSLGITR